MKFVVSQMSVFLKQTGTKRNVGYFLRFLFLLLALVVIYSVLFHYIMAYEGQEHSWITGLYWTLTVMSTLGFGDITFVSDFGRLFSLFVLITGIILLLVMLPFAFIQYVYSPWLEAQKKTNAPRKIDSKIKDHVIVVGLNPITLNLVQLLSHNGFYCVVLCPDIQTSIDLEDQGFNVLVGDYDDETTYKNLEFDKAALLVALDTDKRNTNIIFSARGVNANVPIISKAENADSEDILQLAGSTKVFRFRTLLGQALADRVEGCKGSFSYFTSFSSLLIAERSIDSTSLKSRSLVESNLRAEVGINIVGLWQKGNFLMPPPTEVLPTSATLVMAGTQEQFDLFDEKFSTSVEIPSQHKVVVIGGGKVGLAAAEQLHSQGLQVSLIDKIPIKGTSKEIKSILGDAADIEILKQAGIEDATSVIITTHDDDTNIYLTIYCRRLRPEIQILSRASLDRNVSILHRAGANVVLSLVSMMSNSVVNMLAPGKIFMLRDGLCLFTAKASKALAGKNLIESKIRLKTGCSVVGVRMKGGAIQVNPDPYHVFTQGEEIYLIGNSVDSFIEHFGIDKF